MIAEHEHIVLTSDLPEENVKAGDAETVVFVHVRFFDFLRLNSLANGHS